MNIKKHLAKMESFDLVKKNLHERENRINRIVFNIPSFHGPIEYLEAIARATKCQDDSDLFYDDPNIDLINDFFEDLPFVSFDSLIIMTCKSNINGLLFDNMWKRIYNT